MTNAAAVPAMFDVNKLLNLAHRAATKIQAVSGLTQSDEYVVPASVVNHLADMGCEDLLLLIEGLSAAQ